jgi:hypothetical protein
MDFQLVMSEPSIERDTVSVRGLIVNSDDLTKRRNITPNSL